MTTEEKAKAYDEALERARKAYNAIPTESRGARKIIEDAFPELRESERVIKALETFINQPEIADKITFEARIEWLSWLEKQNEQKPAEKQDYSGLNDLERAIHRAFLCAGVENVPVTIIKETARECLALKPVEWLEEDEIYLQDALWCVEQATKVARDENDMGACWSAERWLKSLRPSWKPSEEQMRALWDAYKGGKEQEPLRELIEQLKKLM